MLENRGIAIENNISDSCNCKKSDFYHVNQLSGGLKIVSSAINKKNYLPFFNNSYNPILK